MVDGYDSSDATPGIPPELDDFICDYVDGSMDPVVRAAFEEFLEANPRVRAHVDEVAETAALLRCHGRCLCAPDGFDNRLRHAVENESFVRSGFGLEALNKLGGLVISGSTIAVVCLAVAVFAFENPNPSSRTADTVLMEMFGEEAQALDNGFASRTFVERAPDRVALERVHHTPYTPAYMRQVVLEQAPIPVFQSVQSSPIMVIYP